MLERPVRARVPVDQTWNLADIYPSPARWAEDAARVDEDVRALAAYQGRLHVDGAVDDGAHLYWAQQPHFYMNLYPYTYAAGLAGGYALVRALREEGQPAVDRWLRLLTRGNTRPALELLRDAGVDLGSAEPLRQAVDYAGSLVDELERSF